MNGWERSAGIHLNPDINFTSKALAREWKAVGDYSASTFPRGPADFNRVLSQTTKLPSNAELDENRFDGQVVIVTGAADG